MRHNEYMQKWDEWRGYIAAGGGGSWPRDAFESFVEKLVEREAECRFLQSRLDHHKEASFAAVAENRRLGEEVERLRFVLESISSLVVEGPEFMRPREVFDAVLKEIHVCSYKNPDRRCNYPWHNGLHGYCWSYAHHVDGTPGYEDMRMICPGCECWEDKIDKRRTNELSPLSLSYQP